MQVQVSALAAGLVFGLGLWISGMANPQKVLGFLDVTGRWDPSLAFVMAGAVAVTLIAFRPLLRRPAPFFAREFSVPNLRSIDAKLVAGSALFGAGWGIAGYCPGPGLTALASMSAEAGVFVAAMIAGGILHRLVSGADKTRPNA
jgi:uncharacterized membrane protein YedE/YeeE